MRVCKTLTNVFNLQFLSIVVSKIQLERPPKQLQEHLEAYFRDGWVIPSLAQLIADKGICSCQHRCFAF
jgi:hypothetical protein